MSIELLKYCDDLENKWEYFVSHSDNGTLFQTRRFLSYHETNKFEDASVCFMRKGSMFAVFPAVKIKIDGIMTLYSHPGASYGGFVIGDKTGLEDIHEMVGQMIAYAEKSGCKQIIITQTPSYYFRKYSSYIDFSLHSHGFSFRKRELSSVLTLGSDYDSMFRKFPDELKRAVRKAEKSGLVFRKSGDIEDYFKILSNNLSMRHGVKPTHTIDELVKLFDLFPDKIKLYSVFKEREMVGGVVSFSCNSQVNLAFYIAHNHDFQKYRPVDLVITEMVRDSVRLGFDYLDFGTFTLNMEPNWGLCRFKEKFGARGVFRDTFERRT